MIISLVLTLLVTASGTIATYLYDEGAPFVARVCAGACIGLTSLGLVGFVFASFFGLTTGSIVITLTVLTLPFLILRDKARRQIVRGDWKATSQGFRRRLLHPNFSAIRHAVFYVAVAVVLWRVFSRAMIETPEGIATGVLNNFGDLPFHLSVIRARFWSKLSAEDPTYAVSILLIPF